LPTTPTRYLLGVLVPGALAVTPWLALARPYLESTLNDSLQAILLFAIVSTVGGVLDALSARIEVFWDERGVPSDRSLRGDHWYAYLCRRDDKRAVAYGYISRLVDSMYFELSTMFALLVAALGTACLAYSRYERVLFLLIVAAALASRFLYLQAKAGHQVLCEVRQELAERNDLGVREHKIPTVWDP
jgi:hypothetical protein